jgi:hypothetical protein
LYDPWSLETEFVRQHLLAIKRHSRHDVSYAAATFDRKVEFHLDLFDAIVIHFSVRMPLETLSSDFVAAVSRFTGPKILLIQDEYDMPRRACFWIRKLGVNTVFTTVPEEQIELFYPHSEVPGVAFKRCLTGYVPDEFPDHVVKPIRDRSLWIAYRGRKLPIWYGELCREKFRIGLRTKAICEARNIPHDIESDESKRIYGEAWFQFLCGTRAMLGTESGCNVMDAFGEIRGAVEAALAVKPQLSEEELYEQYVAPHENNVHMNQISPKTFECIALKTGLVLFPGKYSNVIHPDNHFIALEKDFANVDDVLKRVSDAAFMEQMVDRAYEDIVLSGEGKICERDR